MEILTIINVIWLYLCLAPALLIVAIFLIKLAKNSDISLSPLPHRHNYKQDLEENEMIYLGKTKYGSSKYEVRIKYKCKECEDEYTYIDEQTYGNEGGAGV